MPASITADAARSVAPLGLIVLVFVDIPGLEQLAADLGIPRTSSRREAVRKHDHGLKGGGRIDVGSVPLIPLPFGAKAEADVGMARSWETRAVSESRESMIPVLRDVLARLACGDQLVCDLGAWSDPGVPALRRAVDVVRKPRRSRSDAAAASERMLIISDAKRRQYASIAVGQHVVVAGEWHVRREPTPSLELTSLELARDRQTAHRVALPAGTGLEATLTHAELSPEGKARFEAGPSEAAVFGRVSAKSAQGRLSIWPIAIYFRAPVVVANERRSPSTPRRGWLTVAVPLLVVGAAAFAVLSENDTLNSPPEPAPAVTPESAKVRGAVSTVDPADSLSNRFESRTGAYAVSYPATWRPKTNETRLGGGRLRTEFRAPNGHDFVWIDRLLATGDDSRLVGRDPRLMAEGVVDSVMTKIGKGKYHEQVRELTAVGPWLAYQLKFDDGADGDMRWDRYFLHLNGDVYQVSGSGHPRAVSPAARRMVGAIDPAGTPSVYCGDLSQGEASASAFNLTADDLTCKEAKSATEMALDQAETCTENCNVGNYVCESAAGSDSSRTRLICKAEGAAIAFETPKASLDRATTP